MSIKKYEFWLLAAAIMQCFTGAMHTLGIVMGSKPSNAEEAELLDLMNSYKMDMGAGFHHTMQDIMTSFSISFALLLFFAAFLTFFLHRQKLDDRTMHGVIIINLIIFLICFVTMAKFTFLPPIICCGLIFIFLLIAWFLIRDKIRRSGV